MLIKGSELKVKLKRRKIKIDDIVAKYNLNRATVSRYLNDHIAMPATFIIQVAEFAGLEIDDFMEGKAVKQEIIKEEKPAPVEYKFQETAPLIAAEPEVRYETSKKRERIVIDLTDWEERLEAVEFKLHELEKELHHI
jgi:transcriptional regulator with XRE-family HTH domain